MTATEELRRLLDERGVKWRLVNGDCILWTDADGAAYSARDGFTFAGPDGTLTVFSMAPEQAVAATLGPWTCKVEEYESTGIPVCSECGAVQPDDHTVYYCWCCGRKVEQ